MKATVINRIIKLISKVEEEIDFFSEKKDQLQDNYDLKSDRWKETEKADEMQDEIYQLEEIQDTLKIFLMNCKTLRLTNHK